MLVLVPGWGADLGGTDGAEAALLGALGPPTVRFTAAYAQSPSVFASFGSVLAGLYPSAVPLCGLYDDGTHALDTTERAWCATLPPERHSLPDVLALYGYQTALIESGLHGADAFAERFGAHVTVNGLFPHRATPWNELRASLTAWWSAAPGPRFVALVLPDLMPTCRPELLAATTLHPGGLDGGGDPATAQAALASVARAEGQALAQLLSSLPAERDRWVTVSSTNGLSVSAETGVMGGNRVPALSNNFVLERTTHVPLVVYGPTPPREVNQVVELTDLFPTLAHLGGAQPPAGLRGVDLLSLTGEAPDAYAYMEFGEFLAVRRGRQLLSFRSYQHHPTALDPQLTEALLATRDVNHSFRLHDVVADPYQTTDLAAGDAVHLGELRSLLTSLRTGAAAPPDGTLDPRRLWELRMSPSEGYW